MEGTQGFPPLNASYFYESALSSNVVRYLEVKFSAHITDDADFAQASR